VSHDSSADAPSIVIVAENCVAYTDSLDRPTVDQRSGRKALVYEDQRAIPDVAVVYWSIAQCLDRCDLHPASGLRADTSLDDAEVNAALLESPGRLLQQLDAVREEPHVCAVMASERADDHLLSEGRLSGACRCDEQHPTLTASPVPLDRLYSKALVRAKNDGAHIGSTGARQYLEAARAP